MPKRFFTVIIRCKRFQQDTFVRTGQWLFMELYNNREGVEVMEREMADAYDARSAELKALDKARAADPNWYKRGNMFGMTMYTDLFAGNLKELAKKLPYFKEQKLTYLHLMPLLQMPHPHNDGGYAVEDFDTVDPALGTNKDLENLTRELRKAGMVNLWGALASRDTRLLKAQLDALHALPGNCWFVNYLRCHDDIGWGLDEAAENRFDIDPQKHKEYLYHFYAGDFPGSWAKGELYNYDPATGDARSCGTTASLCGVEQALESGDAIALDYAVRRDLLLHSVMAFLQGFPMLNSGDEIAQLNGWDYKSDPNRADDSRNLHRSAFNWENAKQRTQKGTLPNKLWQGITDEKMEGGFLYGTDYP